MLVHTALNEGCRIASWMSKKAGAQGWKKTSRTLNWLSNYAGYGAYAYQAGTQGPLQAGVSIASGIVAEQTVTKSGCHASNRFFKAVNVDERKEAFENNDFRSGISFHT